MITAQQERDFYDIQYRQFLKMPDHALAINRRVLEKNIRNPAHPFYERRRLYQETADELSREPLAGLRVLDYGCGPADFGVWMATEGAHVTVLDLSPLAVDLALKRASASGVAERVDGVAADASSLPMIEDQRFDLVFACAALHHTMKYPGALDELARVMKPGARLVLCETWGGNPLLNAARAARARLQGEQEEQGEDIILTHKELALLTPWFDAVQVHHMNLLAMGKRLWRGRFKSTAARASVRMLEGIDSVLLAGLPFLRNWCGEALITARRRAS